MKDRVKPPQVEFVPDLYGADPAQLLEIIRTATIPADPKTLLLVAHNPGMHEVALMLAGGGDAAAAKRSPTTFPPRGLRSSTLT